MTERLMLLDFNNILRRSYHAHSSLSFAGLSTGGIFGFINQLCKHVNLYRPQWVMICSDHPPYKRKEVFKAYKEDRKKVKAEPGQYRDLADNRKLVLEFLELLNLPFWEEPGYEADDLMGFIVQKHRTAFDSIILVSNDDDLFQLLQYPQVSLQRGKGDVYTKETFEAEYKMDPEDWVMIVALQGSHNGVPGIEGVGPVKAAKIISSRQSWNKIYSDHKDELDLYMKLARLPYDTELEMPVLRQPARYRERRMSAFFTRLGITMTQIHRDAFERLGG